MWIFFLWISSGAEISKYCHLEAIVFYNLNSDPAEICRYTLFAIKEYCTLHLYIVIKNSESEGLQNHFKMCLFWVSHKHNWENYFHFLLNFSKSAATINDIAIATYLSLWVFEGVGALDFYSPLCNTTKNVGRTSSD